MFCRLVPALLMRPIAQQTRTLLCYAPAAPGIVSGQPAPSPQVDEAPTRHLQYVTRARILDNPLGQRLNRRIGRTGAALEGRRSGRFARENREPPVRLAADSVSLHRQRRPFSLIREEVRCGSKYPGGSATRVKLNAGGTSGECRARRNAFPAPLL